MFVPLRFYLFIALIISGPLSGQDLSGTWEGRGGGSEYAMICIVRQGDVYIGYTYDEGMGYCKCNFLGTFDSVSKKLKGENKGVIVKTLFHTQSRYNLRYSKDNGTEFLNGTAQAKSLGIPISVTYKRINRNIDTTAYMHAWIRDNVKAPLTDSLLSVNDGTSETSLPQKPTVDTTTTRSNSIDSIIAASQNRPADTLSVIFVHEKKFVIRVVDNGIVDGDTVSIIRNGKVIAERIAVSTTPYEFNFTAEADDEQNELILVAHNTGSIPPNTALILIETPSKQYRLTASTDLTKNAKIIFRYKE